MVAFSLLLFSLSISTIVLMIHDHDEIHRLLAGLSGLISLICIFILIPPLIKALLGFFLFAIGHKIFPIFSNY